MKEVESFKLDHTKVKAPYVRAAGVLTRDGVAVSKFDLRLTQPNKEFISPPALHTLEHLLATFMREELPGDIVIDLSPMGCRTGFYLIVWGEPTTEGIALALKRSLLRVESVTTVPATTEVECGNYKSHSLNEAKTVARCVLSRGVSADPFDHTRIV
ncbi:MAG: S-ribosylhomocysteine lyase [Eubacteriales bacterium]|jgi:S-ribosylhomocysteine lyase|nr:S-ribosylhomocysteine lyase [Clostridiales bacterium]